LDGLREIGMAEDRKREIAELSRELGTLKAERDRLLAEAHRQAQERNRIHGEMRKLRLEVDTLKEKRDALNRQVRHLKALREEGWRDCRAKIEELKRLRREIKEAVLRKPNRTRESLESDIEKIEWRIQTESPSLKEERELVEQVKDLENELEIYRDIERTEDKIATLENDVEELKDQISVLRIKISEVAGQSQRFHEKMIGHLQKVKELKAKADEKHGEYIDCREKAKVFHSKYLATLDQMNAIREQVRKEEEKEKARKQSILQERMEKTASDKLKRGERLTFEEFKILAEMGKI